MDGAKLKAVVAFFVAVWFLLGLYLGWWMGSMERPYHSFSVSPEFLVVVAALVVGVVLLGKFRGLFDRFIAGVALIFHSFPTLALVFEPYLYFMYFPVGIFILLTSPYNPLDLFPPTGLYLWGVPVLLRWSPISLIMDIGSGLFFIGTGIFVIALFQLLLGRGLVTSGLYSVVRHPQYLGLTLATLGLTFSEPALRLVSLMSWSALVTAYVFLADREEATLQRKYGGEFLSYKRRVPFLFPLSPLHMSEPLFPSSRLKRYLFIWGISLIPVYIGGIIIPLTYFSIVLRQVMAFIGLVLMAIAGAMFILAFTSRRYNNLRLYSICLLCFSFPTSLPLFLLFVPYFTILIFLVWLSLEKPTIHKA